MEATERKEIRVEVRERHSKEGPLDKRGIHGCPRDETKREVKAVRPAKAVRVRGVKD